jgi:hypothetical protein
MQGSLILNHIETLWLGFDVLQQQVNLIRRFNSIVQTPDLGITQPPHGLGVNIHSLLQRSAFI